MSEEKKRKFDLFVRSDDKQYTAFLWFGSNYITVAIVKRGEGGTLERVTKFRIVSDPILLSLISKQSLVRRLRDHIYHLCDELKG